MAVEVNIKLLFHDFNPGKFIVYFCLLFFSILLALRLDGFIMCSYWVVFLPIWIWKSIVLLGVSIGSWVWWKNPTYRSEVDSYIQYKAIIISSCLHLLLLMFEILLTDKLENNPRYLLWILVFIPLIFMSIISIGICIWFLKNERTYELELFCSVNILQFIFVALRLDNFITWSWGIVFIPMWIAISISMIVVFYCIIYTIFLLRSAEVSSEQSCSSLHNALGYSLFVIPFLIFLILLANKGDSLSGLYFIQIIAPLIVSFLSLSMLSFGSKGSNQWWFGLRKDFCPWLLSICPIFQVYGNIYYSTSSSNAEIDRTSVSEKCTFNRVSTEQSKPIIPIVNIEAPD